MMLPKTMIVGRLSSASSSIQTARTGAAVSFTTTRRLLNSFPSSSQFCRWYKTSTSTIHRGAFSSSPVILSQQRAYSSVTVSTSIKNNSSSGGYVHLRNDKRRMMIHQQHQQSQRAIPVLLQQIQIRTLFGFGGGNKDKNPNEVTTKQDATTTAESLTATTITDDDPDSTIFNSTDPISTPSVDETLNKLFEEQSTRGAVSSTSDSAWYANTEATTAITDTSGAAIWDPNWYNVADNAILAINWIHQTTGLSYGLSIILSTAILRVTMFPIMVQAQRAASRMAYVQPEMAVLKEKYDRLVAPTLNDQKLFTTNVKALFTKYNVNPLQTIIAPVVQIPLFLGMFFGLKKMSTYFPTELQNGGMLWFTDLSVADPYYALPLLSSATFLVLVEVGKQQMIQSGPSGLMMLNVFRFMCIVSLPLVANFEAAMLLYWVSNNCLTVCQTLILKAPYMRKQFGILDPPKPLPGTDPNKDAIMTSITDLMKRAQGKPVTEIEKIVQHNRSIEAKNVSTQLTRAAREREKLRRRRGITGTRNY